MGAIRIAIAATLFASAALAQDAALTDAQRRKAHLPALRAATNCVANTVAALPNATDMLIPGKEGALLVEAIKPCLSDMQFMVNEHDRLYGPGTGLPFYRGPYLNDLPRAVLTRLRPQLETLQASRAAEQARLEAARRAEQEQAAAAQKAKIDTAERARDLLRDRMYGCTNRELQSLVRSGETAEVLASAAMTVCRKEVDEAITAHIEAMSVVGLKPSWDGVRAAVKESVVASAVKTRAATADGPKPWETYSSKPTEPRSVKSQSASV